MADVFSKTERSRIMRQVRATDTTPEKTVRALVHRLGYRFRLHRRDLPGTPDLVFPARRKILFVHGCFWHGHRCARGNRLPKSNTRYWREKIARNKARDTHTRAALRRDGWSVLVVWECQLKDLDAVTDRIVDFLEEE